ncbi:MAG: tRNA preQ1(34) S-adenosylmethionine ribosyltransferase-isomerase QueA, partial [Limnobacter sp.]|nr:tRNA preQ1(34) S-adenosylmethionine ribosyltransferase-isomerase QueA [Limnobacter sp.]
QKSSGGKVEVMVERIYSDTEFLAMVRASKSPKVGSEIVLPGETIAQVQGREGMMFNLKVVRSRLSLPDLLEQHGSMPLPPYIAHEATQEDNDRYQTVFAQNPGAVAAPTAGLHFTDNLLEQVKAMGVQLCEITLHVGAGTFLPVKNDDISAHQMHRERYSISPTAFRQLIDSKKNGGRIVCVGTTSMRALEAWATETGCLLNHPEGLNKASQFEQTGHEGDTDIFITPGYGFKAVDCLITNFHLPESTLLMLVSAFVGKPLIDEAYQKAIEREYRFFSYGDAMWLRRRG